MTQAAQLAQYGANNVGLSFKNRIINGDMTIDQRNNGASLNLSGTGQYTVDRWQAWEDTDGTMTAQQSSVAPTGFTNSLLFTTGTADASLSSGQFCATQQRIEGFNVADLGFGTANAQAVTLSFWVRSSLTGTFGASLKNGASTRSYPFTYTISAANTWEYKTITIAGDTSGTWLTTNGIGLTVNFGLGVSSTQSGTAGSWQSSDFLSATGAVSVIGTAGATWQITGVQLEKGTVATSFDYLPYGTELQLCQRYFFTTPANGTGMSPTLVVGRSNFSSATFVHPVEMRTSPSVQLVNFTGSGDFFTTLDDATYGNYGAVQVRATSTRNTMIRATFQNGTDQSSLLYYQSGRIINVSAEL